MAWGDAGDRLKDYQQQDLIILTNVSIKQFQEMYHLKFDNNSRVFKDTKDIDQKIVSNLLKFRNNRNSKPQEFQLKNISAKGSSQAKTVLYCIDSIKQHAEDAIVSKQKKTEKFYYTTFAYFDSISLKRNITWKREEDGEDRRIFLANAKFTDSTGSFWVTLCQGGDTVLGLSPQEAHKLQEQMREDQINQGNGANSEQPELVRQIQSRKGCGFSLRVQAKCREYEGNTTVQYTTFQAYRAPSELDPNCQKLNNTLLNTLRKLRIKAADD